MRKHPMKSGRMRMCLHSKGSVGIPHKSFETVNPCYERTNATKGVVADRYLPVQRLGTPFALSRGPRHGARLPAPRTGHNRPPIWLHLDTIKAFDSKGLTGCIGLDRLDLDTVAQLLPHDTWG